MSTSVILSWDPAARILEYVEVNGGDGGAAERTSVQADEAADISAQLDGLTLPKVAERIAEDGIVLIGNVSPVEVARCTVTAVGRPEDRRFKFKFRDAERKPEIPSLPIAALGVPDASLAPAAAELEYLYVPELDPPGCWLGCAGGIGAWLSARRPADGGKRLARELQSRRNRDKNYQAQANERFVNPYTFVRFPKTVERAAPGGHHMLGPGRLSGSFTVTWTFTTPWQTPQGVSGTAFLRLPGASVKGAVRAVHETLAGGCLRVFDADYIPSYRDHARVRGPEWKLAMVEKATEDGQPLSVILCGEVVWARDKQLRQAWGHELSTGSRVTIQESDVRTAVTRLGRKELPASAVVGKGGDWVILVTDAGTRRETVKDRATGQRNPGAYFLACGRLGQSTAEVAEAAWRTFRIAVAGARDLHPAELKRTGRDPDDCRQEGRRPMAEVRLGRREIGRRRVVTGRLWEGDVVWVRTAADGAKTVVREVSLAALWRHPGWDRDQQPDLQPDKWSAGSRVPPGLLACRDPADLCPTCRVFGSVDQQARGTRDQARQRAYAGHVRFGDACSEEPVELTQFDRAPLGAPRPGAGQFYLENADTKPARAGRSPTREWGSDPDSSDPDKAKRRPLRGRKFYWHADPAAQKYPRHLAREHQKHRADGSDSEFVAARWLADAGTVLRQRVTFDNLSRAELGSLLAAFEPHRVLHSPGGGPLLLHLGGGKPLGLGSCTAAVGDLQVASASSRYGGAEAEVPDPDGCLREFAAACPAAIIDEVWPSLAAVLAHGTVNPAQVWYPPGRYWSEQDRSEQDTQAFDDPFTFFTESSGMYLKTGQRSLVRLPDPADGDQSLRIIPKEGSE